MGRFRVLLLAVLILCSCKHTTQDQNYTIPFVDLICNTTEEDEISNYIEDVQVIELSFDSLMYVYPGKILINGNYIFALSGGQVYQFDKTGKFLGQIGRIGNGPGEYLSISDICISSDLRKIYCQDSQNNVLVFDAHSREYERTINSGIVGNSSNAIIPYGNKGFALLVNNPVDPSNFDEDFFCLQCYDRNGKLIEEFFKREDFNIPMSFFSNSIQCSDNKYCLSFIPSEGTFYKDDNGSISPYLNLSFGKKSLPFRFAIHGKNDPWDKVEEIFACDYYKCISTLCSTNDVIYCYAFGPNHSRYHFVIDSASKHGIRWKASNFCSVMAAVAADDDYIYYVYTAAHEDAKRSPYYTPDILRTALEEKLNLTYTEYDNPVIIKVKYSLESM